MFLVNEVWSAVFKYNTSNFRIWLENYLRKIKKYIYNQIKTKHGSRKIELIIRKIKLIIRKCLRIKYRWESIPH